MAKTSTQHQEQINKEEDNKLPHHQERNQSTIYHFNHMMDEKHEGDYVNIHVDKHGNVISIED
jgi:uncharacterized protein YuzE